MQYPAIKAALKEMGCNQQEFADRLSKAAGRPVNRCQVNLWLRRHRQIPAWACIPIERITQGRIAAKMVRPDIFDPPYLE